MTYQKLIDSPIEPTAEQVNAVDTLRLNGYAEAMASFIKECDTPITIGIQGDWGIGKTSFLSLVKNHLGVSRGRGGNTWHIYLNTWQYAQFSSEEFLGLSVLNGVIKKIAKEFDLKDDDDTVTALKRYGGQAYRFLARAGNQLVKKKTGVDLAAAAGGDSGSDVPMTELIDMIEDYRDRFASLVSRVTGHDKNPQSRNRLVVMIDDLDRVRPVRALELLEAVKNFLDVPHCVFLLAVDYAVIQQGVAEKLGTDTQRVHGKSYFDKIIQVPFNMPTSAYRLDVYLMSLLGVEWNEVDRQYKIESGTYFPKKPGRPATIDDCHVKFFSNITRLAVGANPRSMKRVVNYVSLLMKVLGDSKFPEHSAKPWQREKLLYALACLQLEWPELFNYFAEHPTPQILHEFEDWDTIDSVPHLKAMLDRTHDPEQLKSNISAFFDEMIAELDRPDSQGFCDGRISTEEFEPVWSLLRNANLTRLPLEQLEDQWGSFRSIAEQHDEGLTKTTRLIALFRKSLWNNPVKFRLVPAGSRFCNMVWDGRQIGSLVSVGYAPVQWWLKLDYHADREPPTRACRWDAGGHYGVGNLLVDIDVLLGEGGGGVEQLNKLLEAVETGQAAQQDR